MMRFILIIILLQSSCVFADKNICNDFECLSQKSLEQYLQDHNQWWLIYNKAAGLAKECQRTDDVKTFLLLWSGQVDGEMAEALYEDTDIILDKHTSCFLSALSESSSSVQDNFFRKWCPFVHLDPRPKIKSHLSIYTNDTLAKKLLKHLNGDECKS